MKEEEALKAISICDKKLASLEEIFSGCANVCKVTLGFTKDESKKGMLSCSITHSGDLALCLWEEAEKGRYEKLSHAIMPFADTLTLRAVLDLLIGLPKKEGLRNVR